MITEHAILQVRKGQSADFAVAMIQAQALISVSPGFLGIQVKPDSDEKDVFLLLVEWENIESHRDGFRKSPRYQEWRALLHPFYDPMPKVRYYRESII